MKRCDLTFRNGGFLQSCDRPYGHPPTQACGVGTTILRTSASPTVERRWQEAQDAEKAAKESQAQTPPLERKVYDPRKEWQAFLNQHHGYDPKTTWCPEYVGDSSIEMTCHKVGVPYAKLAQHPLPFFYAKKLYHCCGVLNIDNWGEEACGSERGIALFAGFMEWAQNSLAAMCLIATTYYGQHTANKLLKDFGFKRIHGHNSNSGNDMSLWVYRLHEAGDTSADEDDDDDEDYNEDNEDND